MIDAIYQMYREQKRLLKRMDEPEGDAEKDLIADIKLSITVLEEGCPEYRERYERELAMQKSFTREQQDWICWQIGEWYVDWKQRIVVDLENGTHRLGYAKECLKEMICGDE